MKTIYWSPFAQHERYPSVQLMYDTPDALLTDLLPRRNKKANGDNWFQCYAFQASVKNSFILRSPFTASFGVDDELGIIPINQDLNNLSNMKFIVKKQPSVINAHTIAIRGLWMFWSEESLEITTSNPEYHRKPYDGYYVGGSFDIGKWFRPIEGAIQLNNEVNAVSIKRNDPLAYVKFHTDEPVQLKRFYMTKELEELHWACINYKQYDPHRTLPYLYNKFTNRGLHTIITKEIKRNVVD
jgi:hypothetical protein